MARRSKSRSSAPESAADDGSQAIRDSAQKIWLAGLGAFERARTEGPRMFETLVEQGRQMGARAVGAADDVLKTLRETNYSGGRWDKLEQVFEDRVSKSLSRLGVVTARDLDDLTRQVQELNATVQGIMSQSLRAATGAAAGTAKGARRATRKSAAAGGRKRKAKRASRG